MTDEELLKVNQVAGILNEPQFHNPCKGCRFLGEGLVGTAENPKYMDLYYCENQDTFVGVFGQGGKEYVVYSTKDLAKEKKNLPENSWVLQAEKLASNKHFYLNATQGLWKK